MKLFPFSFVMGKDLDLLQLSLQLHGNKEKYDVGVEW